MGGKYDVKSVSPLPTFSYTFVYEVLVSCHIHTLCIVEEDPQKRSVCSEFKCVSVPVSGTCRYVLRAKASGLRQLSIVESVQ